MEEEEAFADSGGSFTRIFFFFGGGGEEGIRSFRNFDGILEFLCNFSDIHL